MKLIAPIVVFLLLIAGGIYHHYFYPPTVLERATDNALQQFADALTTKDRAQVMSTLEAFLTDDARIKLEVGFFSLAQSAKVSTQEFDKAGFIAFMDNVTYPLSDYGYKADLDTFTLAEGRKSAQIKWSSMAWADGTAMYGGNGVEMRYSSKPDCTGQVTFEGPSPKLAEATCILTVYSVPKPGEESKLRDPAALGQYLR